MSTFILALMGAIWDLRTYTSYRAELAREMFVVAEAIATQIAGADPVADALVPVGQRLGRISRVGRIDAVIVVRGTTRHDSTVCVDDDQWCAPFATMYWPAVDSWSDGTVTDCDNPADLPAAGDHFLATQKVLLNEDRSAGGGIPLPVSEWTSRNLHVDEWWVVLDTCILPNPGVFFGAMGTLGRGVLNLDIVIRRRAAWPSAERYVSCTWCTPK